MERSILFHITRSVVSLQMQNERRLKKKIEFPRNNSNKFSIYKGNNFSFQR